MIDSFMILAPLLMLPVVALFCFVGCQLVFPLDENNPTAGPAPTNLVGAAGNNKAALSWDAYPEAVSFSLKRGEISGSYDVTFSVPAPTDPTQQRVSFTDTGALNGKTYFYAVSAIVTPTGSLLAESELSNEVQVSPSVASLVSFVLPFTGISPVTTVSGFFGMAFRVGALPIDVQTLGRGCLPGNSQIHAIKIVDENGIDVPNAFVSVNMSGATPGQFQYSPLPAPVTLPANARFLIVSQEVAGQDAFFNHDMTIQTTDVATVVSSVRGGPPFQNDNPGLHSYGPVSFQY